jgi:putative endonuclease
MFRLTDKREKGNEAEQIACDHLAKNGYKIITRNFNCRVGEIDIIAQNGEDLVFVEVRSWRSAATVNPIHTISRRKQERVIRAAELYLAKHVRGPIPARFDVVIVKLGAAPEVELIQNAFGLERTGMF